MSLAFGQMLDAGKQMFDTASNALLGGTDLSVIRDDLFATDLRINAAEQQIRRELVVHVTVHGTHDLPACLTMMSVVKDAERIGDYAKNIFDLAELTPAGVKEKEFDDLNGLKSSISRGLADTRRIFEAQSEDEARAVARDLMSIEDRCDTRMADLVLHQREHACPVTYALTYRYFKRVASHAMNIVTSVYLPLDKIDFFDEKPRPTGVRKPETK
jgi:phosphate uptake regulator